jgi:hypothetical protein
MFVLLFNDYQIMFKHIVFMCNIMVYVYVAIYEYK